MNDINTAEETPVEFTDDALYDILTVCQAIIFRDIWRLHDVDAALKMFFTMQSALPDDLDRSDTPNLNTLSDMLRNEPDVLRDLEFIIGDPRVKFSVIRYQDKHSRRSAAIRAAKRAEEGERP